MRDINRPEVVLSNEERQRLPPYEKEHYIKQVIRETVHLNPNGVTANQIAKAFTIDPRIVDKHLSVMVHTNEIYTQSFDETVVYFPNTRALHPISHDTFPLADDLEVQSFKLHNRLGDFVFIQAKKKNEFRVDVNSGMLIPMDKFPDFVQYLKTQLSEMIKGV
jgi:hypothetical protein